MSIEHNAIRCAICQHPFFSTVISSDPKESSEELIGKLGQHLELRHKEELIRNTLATKNLGTLILIHVFLHNMAVVPEANIRLSEYALDVQDEILKYLGFDESDDEEEDNDEEMALSVITDIRDKTEDAITRNRLNDFIKQYMAIDTPEEIADTKTV